MKAKAHCMYSYASPVEFKVVTLRECPHPSELLHCDRAGPAIEYWRTHVATAANFNPDCECLVTILLNARLRIKGHHFVSMGTMDTILVHAREVFRTAVIAAAHSIVLVHNHPSGDPTPSEADIRATRDLIRSGQVLQISLTDHIVVGGDKHVSIRELGYFS
jgi:DNA repair protein RadC